MREMESTVSEIDLNTYIHIIDHIMPPLNEEIMQENPLIKYSGPISQIRAYIFSCISGDPNTNVMTDE
jgi:hypothetical protein